MRRKSRTELVTTLSVRHRITQNNSTRGVIIRKYAQLQMDAANRFLLNVLFCVIGGAKCAYYFTVRFTGQLRRSLTYPPVLLVRSVAAIVCNYARLPHRCRRSPASRWWATSPTGTRKTSCYRNRPASMARRTIFRSGARVRCSSTSMALACAGADPTAA
jgi:hypothetical protein